MGYLHVDIECVQSSKKPGAPCGDVVGHDRNPAATTMVCSDGLGSGIKANIAATMCVSRLLELLRRGASLREAFNSLVATMNDAREKDLPYAVFTVARIRSDGEATVLSYEMPEPILLSNRVATILSHRSVTVDCSLIHESLCHMRSGEGLLVVSDGVTQAGLGAGWAEGWRIEGVARSLNDCLTNGMALKQLPTFVHDRAREIWDRIPGDDCTAALALCRAGQTVTVLTGPPENREEDAAVVNRFMQAEGRKIVSGATTAKVVSRGLGCRLVVQHDNTSVIAPPNYSIRGIDLVTEGAITLNQINNIFEEDPSNYEAHTGVTKLCEILHAADRIDFLVGSAVNPANSDILYRQQGILPRARIVPLLAERLRKAGKLVTIETV